MQKFHTATGFEGHCKVVAIFTFLNNSTNLDVNINVNVNSGFI